MSNSTEKERKIGIWGIGEPLGAAIAERLVELGISPSSIVGIYTKRSHWVSEMKALGIELHQEPQTPKSLTGLGGDRVFERFIFLPTADQSPRSLQGAVTRYLSKSVGETRQVRHFYYVGPVYDSSVFFPSQSVYPAMEHAIQTKAHGFTILRHSLLMDDVFDLQWLARTLSEGVFYLSKGTESFNFCRVDDVAEAVVRMLGSRDLPESIFRWQDEGGEGFKAQLSRPKSLHFSPKDVVAMLKKYFDASVRYEYVDEAQAGQILRARRISYTKRYDNATWALNSLLTFRPDLYRHQNRQMSDLLGGEAGFGTLEDYFADLKADYDAYLAEADARAQRKASPELIPQLFGTAEESREAETSATDQPAPLHDAPARYSEGSGVSALAQPARRAERGSAPEGFRPRRVREQAEEPAVVQGDAPEGFRPRRVREQAEEPAVVQGDASEGYRPRRVREQAEEPAVVQGDAPEGFRPRRVREQGEQFTRPARPEPAQRTGDAPAVAQGDAPAEPAQSEPQACEA